MLHTLPLAAVFIAGIVPQGAGQVVPAQYSCGPFLLQPGPRTMSIVVDHEFPLVCELHLRVQGRGNPKIIQHKAAKRHHIFRLEKLEPDTLYHYELRTGKDVSSGKRSFRTLPLAPQRYKIVAMGDSRSQPEVWRKVAERIAALEKDALFLIGTGDYPNDGRRYQEWVQQFFIPGRALLASKPIWPTIGNHEFTRTLDGNKALADSRYFSLFELPGNERWYRVDYQFVTLLFLDSNSHMGGGTAQYEWLYRELRAERKRFTLVVFHHAPYSSGPHVGKDALGKALEWQIDEARRFLSPLFEMYGVDLVLNGHDHIYERSEKNAVVYIVTGGAGAPLYNINTFHNPYQNFARSTHHYLRIIVTARQLELFAVDLAGHVFDRTTIAVSKNNLARRRFHLGNKLDASLRVESGTQMGRLALVLDNPLDHPLELTGAVLSTQSDVSVKLDVRPGQSRKKELDFRSLLRPLLRRGKWVGAQPVYVSLKLHLEGQDQAMRIEKDIFRNVLLRRALHVVKKARAPRLDAKLSEWQRTASLTIAEKSPISSGRASYTGRSDCRADLRLRWSEDALHLALDVIDDQFVGGGAVVDSDSVHFFFANASGQDTAGTAGTVVFSFYADGRTSTIPIAALAKLRFLVKKNSKGYRLEASLPFSVLPLTGKATAGAELLFGCLLVDSDQLSQPPSHHRLWSRDANPLAREGYGVLRLGR